jgi:hypothetical protein
MEMVEVVKVYGQTVWVESDFFGSKHVMVQSDAPGTEPFCYCSFHYGYGYTDNRSVHEAAQRMAVSLGATEPVEFRQREFKVPNAKSEPTCAAFGAGRLD